MDKRIKIKKMFPKVDNFRKCLLRIGDEVLITTGSEKGKKGKIINFDRKRGKIKVEGIKMLTHFVKKSQETEGGIIKAEGFIDISNVMFLEGDKPVRLGRNSEKKRVSKKTQKEV
jgi:large subunit ribosomal protein L24